MVIEVSERTVIMNLSIRVPLEDAKKVDRAKYIMLDAQAELERHNISFTNSRDVFDLESEDD